MGEEENAQLSSNGLSLTGESAARQSGPSHANATTSIQVQPQQHHQTSYSPLKQQFLPCAGDPPLRWQVWIQMFDDHLLCQGLENSSDQRKLAFLRSSLGREGYRVCRELCPVDAT